MKCPKCRSENPANQKFCGNCGTSLPGSGSPEVTKTLETPAQELGRGTLFTGRYEILEEIGRGGMGVVYKARDIKLRRHVALKFLPEELTRDKKARARFIQEAQAAAALDHPNICTVYEVDDLDDGQTFISMSYIEGQSLKDKLAGGPLEIEEAKAIILQVAEGLKEAHEKGIVHRDIKPANIMLTKKGQAKIMDFGVAKLSWGVDLTKASTIIGTVAYMSPEQARGAEVDLHTDIWSLGAMFYEMLTGERPFHKDHEQALIYSILNEPPEPVSSHRPDVPEPIEAAILKALNKNAAQRFQSAGEFNEALEMPPPVSSSKSEKSIAVLPFTNMSADPEQEYFCDGMMDEIITKFSNFKGWRIIGRTTMVQYKNVPKNYKEIGRELDVSVLLEGSVQKDRNNIRVIANLIDVRDSSVLWSDSYNRKLECVFEIQSDIALNITQALNIRLNEGEKEQLMGKPTENMEAYNLVLLGRQYFNKVDFLKSIEYYEQAIDLDSEYAEAYAGLAESWFYLGAGYWNLKPSVAYPLSQKAAARALALNPKLSSAVAIYGYNEFWHNLDWETGESMLKKAIKMDPSSPFPHFWLAGVKLCASDFEEGIAEINQAISCDPVNLLLHANAALHLYFAGKNEQSLKKQLWLKRLDPTSPYWTLVGLPLAKMGRTEEALNAFQEGVRVSGRASLQLLFLAYGYALVGDEAESRKILAEMEELEKKEYVFPVGFAYALKTLGDLEGAISRLQQAFEERAGILFLRDPVFSDLRSDKRFSDLLELLTPPAKLTPDRPGSSLRKPEKRLE